MKWMFIWTIIWTATGLGGCAHPTIKPDPSYLPAPMAAEALVQVLTPLIQHNETVETFKGLGRIQLWGPDGRQIFRAAWIGRWPDHLRMDALGPGGQPVMSLATDGEWLYGMSYGDGQYLRQPVSRQVVMRPLPLPLSVLDLITLMAGRIPGRPYHTLTLWMSPQDDERILALQGPQGQVVQQIGLNQMLDRIRWLQYAEEDELEGFKVHLSGEKQVEDTSFPARIALSRPDQQAGLELELERVWIHVGTPEDLFVLSPP